MNTHKTTRDGKTVFEGSAGECWIYIHKHQSQSVDWACKYEGWKIEPMKGQVEPLTFRNKNWTGRNYECTNVVACQADQKPNENYVLCDSSYLEKLTHPYTENNVRYFGYL
jgi:hypothetical protein